jgi:phosphotriesterase-related protein
MMTRVPTPGGGVDSADLGTTMMHEHVFVLTPEININYPETLGDEEAHIEHAVALLTAAHERGVSTIVDCTVPGLGRDVRRVQRVAERVPVNIVCATGYYTWNDLPNFFGIYGPTQYGAAYEAADALPAMLLRDVEKGIGGTSIRAAVLKCVVHKRVTPGMERIARAVAEVHHRTGVPITVHTHSRPDGLDAQRLLSGFGLDLTRVIIGHMDAAGREPDYLQAVLDQGSTVGFDTFGIEGGDLGGAHDVSFADRIETIVSLCVRGYSRQVVLSHDYASFCDQVPAEWFTERFPRWSYHRVVEDAVPALRTAGVSEEHLHDMLVGNPRRFFESCGR